MSGAVFLRDVLFYVFALLMLLGVALYGSFTIPWAIAFLALYAIFVVYVFLQDKHAHEKRVRQRSEEGKNLDHSQEILTEIYESTTLLLKHA